ncbi:LacI family DNA-binding transcriptional regulator [Variovorax saccharolyticus]|uniref:LacI family DNA-binding transcriptional regulator n=1 Tax=Variovorax saccharolyticus TaxID=3053516 RepID=UPI002578238E|nr:MULTISPECIES: LacI family DNA-binding transcriptional regulator [unclassified Variovorax]MDM0022143.1 LacI family DNA-binding transcriptional regulator [Variovorax sp. J22R187]MDM0029630.1 LacI family DNA-binding transcriptional regulator [Variovorax sp. J31P216]
MKSSATAQEVARLAQVSQSAVSRTFTPGASVSEDTRNRVLAAAKTLGYRPNALARSLITRRSRIIALVMSYLQNQFYPLVIEKLSQSLQKQGYHVLMFISDLEETDGVLAEILQYQVDGIVMASAMLSPDLARQCAESGVPVVLFNRVPDISAFARHSTSSVTSDNHRGGRMVAELLLARGHRRIAFLAGLEKSSTNLERERGFNEVLEAAGVAVFRRAVGHYSFELAKEATRELFAGPDLPDAVFVANDHMAIAAMDVLRQELGLRVPEDVSVVGFDDVPQASWGAYRLTTVVQSVEDMVEATVELLHEQMREGTHPRNVVIPCRVVERDSVRAAG